MVRRASVRVGHFKVTQNCQFKRYIKANCHIRSRNGSSFAAYKDMKKHCVQFGKIKKHFFVVSKRRTISASNVTISFKISLILKLDLEAKCVTIIYLNVT